MTQEEFKTLRKGHTLVSPLGGYLTIAEAKQNAKAVDRLYDHQRELREV